MRQSAHFWCQFSDKTQIFKVPASSTKLNIHGGIHEAWNEQKPWKNSLTVSPLSPRSTPHQTKNNDQIPHHYPSNSTNHQKGLSKSLPESSTTPNLHPNKPHFLKNSEKQRIPTTTHNPLTFIVQRKTMSHTLKNQHRRR